MSLFEFYKITIFGKEKSFGSLCERNTIGYVLYRKERLKSIGNNRISEKKSQFKYLSLFC